jgi:hypothetical protein
MDGRVGRGVPLPRSPITMWKRSTSTLIILLLASSLLSALSLNAVIVSAGEYPAIYVDPPSIIDETLTPGNNFTISIKTDYTGSDITAWQLALSYNPAILNGIAVTNGDLITTAVSPYARFMPGSFDNTAGKLSLTGAFFFYVFPPPFVTSGPGTLANVTFTVVGLGDSPITLESETKLVGWDFGEGEVYDIINAFTMPFHIQHGYFRNAVVEHDVAVIDVSASATEVVEGDLVEISVEVENQGAQTENVIVEVYYDYQPGVSDPGQLNFVGTKKALNLPAGGRTSLTFNWNTTYVPAREHNITALASERPGETDLQDNTHACKVTVAMFAVEPIPTLLIIGIVMAPIVAVGAVILVLRRGKPRYHARE